MTRWDIFTIQGEGIFTIQGEVCIYYTGGRVHTRDVIRRLCNKDRDQGQKGIGVRYRSCSDIQYKGKYGLRHLFMYSVHSCGVCKQ